MEKGDLNHALSLLRKHDALEATRQNALRYATTATEAMQALPEHPLRMMLIDLADYVVARVS